MNETTQRNQRIKKSLCSVFPKENVSVTGGRGTACGWVNIKIKLERPADCQCQFITQTATWAKVPYQYTYRKQLEHSFYCDRCLEELKKNEPIVGKLVYGCGEEFSHYYADDGYNTEHAEVLIDVEVK